MGVNLQANMLEAVSMILFGIGFGNLLLQKNLIKKIIGLNIMDSAYINPIPSGLVLTGIVVSVSVSALMLSLTIRLYRRYHTLDLDQISMMMKREE